MEKDRSTRSFQPIVRADLERLLELARADRADFFARCPDWARLYADRVLCTALCQGAALHYVDGTTGINDFDVYTFYAAHPDRAWYAKRIQAVDFGDAKFGRSQVTKSEFVGRRVDLMGRSLPVRPGTDPVQAVQNYLRQLKTETACELAAKAVVILEPRELTGVVAWPAGASPGLTIGCRGCGSVHASRRTTGLRAGPAPLTLVSLYAMCGTYGASAVQRGKEGYDA